METQPFKYFVVADKMLFETFERADKAFQEADKIKFQRLNEWRKTFIPSFPGLYALYEKKENSYSLLYIGETGNLRQRMGDVCRTVNHTFRKQLGYKHFGAARSHKKFIPETEKMLNEFFDNQLYVSFLEVNFGRAEIEAFLVTKYQKSLLNSETKRKLKINLENTLESKI